MPLRFVFPLALILCFAGGAFAQLPPDAIDLGKVKISEKFKSTDIDPVTGEPTTPDQPTWEHNGVTYRGSAESKAKFMAEPDKYAEQAAKLRWEKNYIEAMSKIWCPVTDEVTPGGLKQWVVEGITWESCCQFCDETVKPEDFPKAMTRLQMRAAKSYELAGGKYVEGASSPVEGAIREDVAANSSDHDHETASEGTAAESGPAYLRGKELKPTWSEGIALIFENRCISCHRPGEIAPMSFMTLPEVKKWTKSMKETVASRTMPPWPAHPPESGEFFGSMRLSKQEVDLITQWADAGFPAGEGEYTSETEIIEGWNIGKPDVQFDIPEHTLGKDVTSEVKEFTLETKYPVDRWVLATEARISDPFAVKYIEAGPFGTFGPGATWTHFAPGVGRKLSAGEKVVVKVHYVKEAGFELPVPASKLGVKFTKNPSSIEHTARIGESESSGAAIAGGADQVEVKTSWEMPADGHILSVRPALGLRGKDVKVAAKLPDGTERLLVEIPKWNPDWQFVYQVMPPVDAPKGTVVEMIGHFDNSAMNVRNPDAKADVKTGAEGEVFRLAVGYSVAE